MEFKLPETKVTEYLENFGIKALIDKRKELLVAAAANEFHAMIRKFNLYLADESDYNSDSAALYAAIEAAAINQHPTTVKYLIDTLGFQTCFSKLALILLENHSSDGLKYAIETQFPSSLSWTMKADVLIYLVKDFSEKKFSVTKVAELVIKFCKMAKWTVGDIHYTGHPSKQYQNYFGQPTLTEYDGIIRYCLKHLN